MSLVLLCLSLQTLGSSAHYLAASASHDIGNTTDEDPLEQQALEWRQKRRPFSLLSTEEKMLASDKLVSDFRSALSGVQFHAAFTNYTVLQRAPQLAAIYGACDTPNVQVTVHISDDSSDWAEMQQSVSDMNGDWKVLLSKGMSNGGSFTVAAQCPQCANPNVSAVVYNVTFGDVYYCSGQSNMELDMHYTFSRNITYAAIARGHYANIRYFTQYQFAPSEPQWVAPPRTGPANTWQTPNNDTLDTFSAPCWYFAQSLVDRYPATMEAVTFGLVDVAVGGSIIEQWIRNQTLQLYCKDSLCPQVSCGNLFNGLVTTYVNYTVKSFLWYQGENNVGHAPSGSWANLTGYGCAEPFMLRQWRELWSVVPGTTPADVPFGLVTLAAGTSEGHSAEMGNFRVAQENNYQFMPNSEMVNSFVALAHDLGDPWNKNCYYIDECLGDAPYSWNKTNFFMGPIHPRPKLQVGQRLAVAGYPLLYNQGVNVEMTTGPLISGCTMDNITQTITVRFNSTFLMGNKVRVDPFVAWYNTSVVVQDWSAMTVNFDRAWHFVNISKGDADNEVVADISFYLNLGKVITGIQYAYSDYPCCGNLNRDYNPCPPNSCPIKAGAANSNWTLPAVPFWAQIINDTCECYLPATCNS